MEFAIAIEFCFIYQARKREILLAYFAFIFISVKMKFVVLCFINYEL